MFTGTPQRPVSAVPLGTTLTLVLGLLLHAGWQVISPAPVAIASELRTPADTAWLRAASLGEPIAFSQLLVLYLQAFDNQPGLSIPFRELNYDAVQGWLQVALDLDPAGQYPLMMASQLYAVVPDEDKQRQMLAFVHRAFLDDPNRRWRWLAHAAIVAKHRLNDRALALLYATDITRLAIAAPGWARQMRIFIMEDIGESGAAAVLLGGLLASGEVTDPAEMRFLTLRLEAMKAAEKSSKPSEIR